MSIFSYLFTILVYPGFIFAFILGLIFYWVFRKLRARMQYRRGPPWFQPFADLVKLFSKRQLVPRTSCTILFAAMPLCAFIAIWLSLLILPAGSTRTVFSFDGDLLLLLYLLVVPSVAIMIGASSSSSPYGAVGSNREMIMMLVYETLLVFSVISTGLIANTLSITEIIRYQHLHGWLIFKIPGFFLGVATFLCLIGKFHLKPFDIPDAEQEIVAGTVTEYSGSLLGVLELSKTLMWYAFAALFVNLFLGGGDGLELALAIPVFLVKSLFVVAMFTVVHVSSARYKIDQAFVWYLKYPMTIAIIGFVTALFVGG